MTVADPPAEIETVSDLLERLGAIPPDRVRMKPVPGTATVQDVIKVNDRTGRLCELVDGTLVEKAAGYKESALALAIAFAIRSFVDEHNLGIVTGADGMVRLFSGLVRGPDVAFVSWDRIPGRRMPEEPVPHLVPNLAVEVLSKGNTPNEMSRKRQEYFRAGVEVVWIVDPKTRQVDVYNSPGDFITLNEPDVLTGGSVLSVFTLSLSKLFAELDRGGDPERSGTLA